MAKQGTYDHPKTKDFARLVGIEQVHAYGILCRLWEFAAEHVRQGDVGKYRNEILADEVGWQGDPHLLVAKLVESRWLDADVPAVDGCSSRLMIHDWAVHCEDSVHMRLAREHLLFARGDLPRVTRLAKEERAPIDDFYRSMPVPVLELRGITPQIEPKRSQAQESARDAQPNAGKRTTIPYQAMPSQAGPEPLPDTKPVPVPPPSGGSAGERKKAQPSAAPPPDSPSSLNHISRPIREVLGQASAGRTEEELAELQREIRERKAGATLDPSEDPILGGKETTNAV